MNQLLRNEVNRWGIISRLFHWSMAFLVIGLLYVGLIMVDMPASPEKFELYSFHKSYGLIALGLVILRLIWRNLTITPTLTTRDIFSKLSAPIMYITMVLMPVSGIIMSQAGGHPISFFGWFTFPILLGKNPELGRLAWLIHVYTGKIFIAIICLHFCAALYHQWGLKNNLLRRMIKGY